MKKLLLTLPAIVLVSVSCGATESSDAKSILKPDLQFSPGLLHVAFPSGVTIGVANGGTIRVPCNAPGISVKYTYKNAGRPAARPHSITGMVAGLTGSGQGVGALAGGQSRTLVMNISLAGLPNHQVRAFALTLDASGVVNESSEANNVFSARVLKRCP